MFDRVDANHDGVITRAEWNRASGIGAPQPISSDAFGMEPVGQPVYTFSQGRGLSANTGAGGDLPRAAVMVEGVDRNNDGIPDVLQMPGREVPIGSMQRLGGDR